LRGYSIGRGAGPHGPPGASFLYTNKKPTAWGVGRGAGGARGWPMAF